VYSFLANIKFSREVKYQTYKFAIKKGKSSLQEFVVAGRHENEKVILGYMKV
jgi:hypothetical protein